MRSKPGLVFSGPGFLSSFLLAGAAMAENPAELVEMGRMDVIATTPLPGLGSPLAKVPANVQVFTGRELTAQRPLSLPDFLDRNATGVTVNSGQGNAFQPDVTYRGFTASPLLGFPQGLSVYQDGVRVNESFGDAVNWDLIPRAAIASVQLVPGSNPAFGLNTLGGAIAVHTKSGTHFPGGAVEGSGGSFRRGGVEIVQGGADGALDHFIAADAIDDGGWAAHNSSRIRRLFAKVGYQTERSDLDVSLTAADNAMNGTQTLPRSFFLEDIRQPYTYPDRNGNRLAFLTVKGSRFLAGETLAGGTAYVRRFRNENFASNVNDGFGLPSGAGGEIDDVQATNDRAVVDQSSAGFGLQLTLPHGRAAGNPLVVGASADFGRVRFTRRQQDARFTADRGAVGTGDFVTTTDATSRVSHLGIYASEGIALGERWVLSAAAGYNISRIRIADESGLDPLLDGSHRFSRLNPAVALTFNPTANATAYAAYNESMRAPSAMELTCADPQAPCKLPGNFLADPPLRAVVARTLEAGTRGEWSESSTWSAAAYVSELRDDIQFVASTGVAANSGYFRNVGTTRREGLELAARHRWGAVELAARYSHIRATFRSPFLENSPNNSSADASGAIPVQPGDRIPGIPRHSLKLRFAYEPSSAGSAAASVVANSSSYARGDENNRDARGRIPGYAVVNLDARWRPTRDVELFVLVDNAFDKRYANLGVLGRNFFLGPGHTFSAQNAMTEQFLGAGAPRGAWAGARFQWR